MEDKIVRWHPGFVAAMNLEFVKDRDSPILWQKGAVLFPTQVIVARELEPLEHIGLKSLSNRLEKQTMAEYNVPYKVDTTS